MKTTNVIIAIVCAVICVLGWVLMTTDTASASNEYKQHIELADAYMEEGLYQRAIKDYMAAFDSENSVEIAEKIAAAYALRFEEDPEGTYENCVDDLEKILEIYPGHKEISMQLATIYANDENYTKAYTWLKNAVDNGAEGDDIMRMLRQARYSYNIRSSSYQEVRPATGKSYVVSRNDLWGIYHLENGVVWDCDYPYISQANADGVVLVTMEKDSRIIDGEGMVMGIFKDKVVSAGVYGEGLIAASTGGTYAYYNEFAKKQFGDYEEAGTFIDGLAAVKRNGKWVLVDTEGTEKSDTFDHIVLNMNGEYISNDMILAAKTAGQYKVYNEKFEEQTSLGKYEAVDILTEDGIIAVCQNGKWGFVDTEGEVVIKPAYDAALSFSNGLAAVCKDGMWGYIDKENNLVIDYVFYGAGYFNAEGATMVCVEIDEVAVEDEELPADETEGADEVIQTEEDMADATEPTEGNATEPTVAESTEPTEALDTENTEDNGENDELGDMLTPDGEDTDEEETVYELVESWSLLKLINGIVED